MSPTSTVSDAVAAYDALAPYYRAISAARSGYLEAVEKIIVKHARGADSLLDIGAGDATRTCLIARAAGIRRIVAVEPSAGMRAQCKQEIRFWRCKAAEIPETGQQFDVVTCLWNVLGHIESAEERLLTLTKARKLLAPGGIMFVDLNHRYNASVHGWCRTLWNIVHDHWSWSPTNGDVVISWSVGGRPIYTHGHLFTQRELDALFQAAGLTIKDRWVLNYRTGAVCNSPYQGSLLYQLTRDSDGPDIAESEIVRNEAALVS